VERITGSPLKEFTVGCLCSRHTQETIRGLSRQNLISKPKCVEQILPAREAGPLQWCLENPLCNLPSRKRKQRPPSWEALCLSLGHTLHHLGRLKESQCLCPAQGFKSNCTEVWPVEKHCFRTSQCRLGGYHMERVKRELGQGSRKPELASHLLPTA
jgi:hypothetical protein